MIATIHRDERVELKCERTVMVSANCKSSATELQTVRQHVCVGREKRQAKDEDAHRFSHRPPARCALGEVASKSFLCERAARTCLEVTLKLNGALLVGERNCGFDSPRTMLGGVWNSASIMFRQASA